MFDDIKRHILTAIQSVSGIDKWAPGKGEAGQGNGEGMQKQMLINLMRDPITIFFAVSGVIFFAHNARMDARDEIIVTQGAVDAVIDNFESIRGREASEAERADLQAEYIREELLFLEALEKGMQYTDPKAREILVDNMKRQLAGDSDTPTVEALIDFYTANTNLYTTELSYSFGQIFFLNPPDPSNDVLQRLNRGELVKGDPFWQGSDFPAYGVSILRSIFNPQFVQTLEGAPLNQWAGPYETSRGWHYIIVRERHEPQLMPFAQVQNQVDNDYRMAIAVERIKNHTEALETKYDIRYEG